MRRALILAAVTSAFALTGCQSGALASSPASAATAADSEAMQDLLDYARSQQTTGFIVMRDGRTLVERNWPAPTDPGFGIFAYGTTDDGQLLEDVASQQKSFVSVLIGIAVDKGLVDVDKAVGDYIGAGWSKASPEREAKIRVIDVLTMSSGLDDKFEYVAPPGTRFFYNTPVYAISKRILTAAAGETLDRITDQWLVEPVGMVDTAWRQRPPALGDVGNSTGLVTTPSDIARFGQMILAGGVAADGARIISEASLRAMFGRSASNPAYGRLWWLNGGDFVVRPGAHRAEGPLIRSAPADLVAALGFLDRRLYVVPSLDLVVVRTGNAAPDADFDAQLWTRLMRVVG